MTDFHLLVSQDVLVGITSNLNLIHSDGGTNNNGLRKTKDGVMMVKYIQDINERILKLL